MRTTRTQAHAVRRLLAAEEERLDEEELSEYERIERLEDRLRTELGDQEAEETEAEKTTLGKGSDVQALAVCMG